MSYQSNHKYARVLPCKDCKCDQPRGGGFEPFGVKFADCKGGTQCPFETETCKETGGLFDG